MVILLLFLYLNLATSIDLLKTRVSSTENTIYKTTGTGNKSDQLENSIADIKNDLSSLKSATCKSISRLFELNGKHYSCVIGGLR